jgi:hypothetical protein
MSRRGKEEPTSDRQYGVALHGDESVVLVAHPSLAKVWPKYVFTLGLYALWRKRNVSMLTSRRIVTGKGIFSRTERSTSMNHVEGASYQRKGLSGYCAVDANVRGRYVTQRLGPMSARKARRFTEEIDSRS